MSRDLQEPSGPERELGSVHARFARAVLLIYLGTGAVAVALLVLGLATDLTYQQGVARETLLLETQVRAHYLGQHLHLLAGELTRLGLRSEVNLLDQNIEPERSLLRLAHEKSSFFNVGVSVVGLDGAVLWSEPRDFLPVGESMAGESWYQSALRSRGAVVVPVQPEREKDSLLYVASPVLRGGRFAGMLLGGVDLAREGTLGAEFHPGAHALDVLATRQGTVIFPPKPPAFAATFAWSRVMEKAHGDAFITESILPAPEGEVPGGRRNAESQGVPTVVAGAPVSGTEFLLLSLAESDQLFGPARARMKTRLAVGLTLALAPLLLLVLLLRRSFQIFRRSEERALRDERLRMLGEAVNLIAHEVKNSLNGLRVALEMILQGDRSLPGSRQGQAAGGLRTEVERLSNFATELLSFSKGVAPRTVSLDLSEFGRKVTDLARTRAESLGVALELAVPDHRVSVKADPSLIHTVIVNLVGNSLDALAGAHVEKPRVSVSLNPAGSRAFFRVRDNGPGVPPQILSRLFDPFVTGKPSGVGIGLALSRKIARAHGGDLVLEAPGPGASFLLTLPLETP
jgi:signal transduction histidine kinase